MAEDLAVAVPERIKAYRSQVQTAQAELKLALAADCGPEHRYVQHRDMRPPWCPDCGFTKTGYHKTEIDRRG